jgi:hypothetical protein
MAILDLHKEMRGTDNMPDGFRQAQGVLMRVAQDSQSVREIQMVCDHLSQIIALQKQVMDMQAERFLPPSCDHPALDQTIQQWRNELDEARRTPRMVGTNEDLRWELDDMTRDVREAS